MLSTRFNMKTMKKLPVLTAIAAIALTAAIGCKSNEENYRRAYEKAKAREREGIDSTIYDRIRREARPAQTVVDGDTVDMKREYVMVTSGQGLDAKALKRYEVVVGQFKQLFHAQSLKKRFAAAGYPGAFIIETREPLYYVVAAASDTIATAAETQNKLKSASPVKLNDTCPYILHPSNKR